MIFGQSEVWIVVREMKYIRIVIEEEKIENLK